MRLPEFLRSHLPDPLPSRRVIVGYTLGILVVFSLLAVASFAIGGKDRAANEGAKSSTAASAPATGASSSPAASSSNSSAKPGASSSPKPEVPKDVTVSIANGDTGLAVARKLAAAHVVASSADFYQLLLSDPSATFYPGTYTLRTQQDPEDALDALNDPANRVQVKLVVPEGFTAAQIYARAAKVANLSVPAFESAAKDPSKLGVPKLAPNIEGWLFPATYTFEPGVSASTILKAMVARTKQALDIPDLADTSDAERQQVLTLASIIQKESGAESDDAKVSRVFINRIASGMPLQSDATVSYGAGGSTVVPTKAEYASKNGYNTYTRTGLPIGPISNPGDAAINAALHPAKGKWLYFVTVNLETGETVFSNTLAEHEVAVAQFRTWLKAHPDYAK